MDWSKHQSRMPIIEEKADYPLEQAIEDYALWNESINPHRAGIIFDRYVADIRKSQQNLNDSLYWYIQNCMEIIEDSFKEYRERESLHYPLHVLLMVIMIAKQYGCQNAQDIADFYNIHYLELFITLPEVPSFKSPISATTIRTAMMLVTPEDTEKFFEEYFTKIKIHIREQIKYDDENFYDRNDDIADTVSFDGQEMKDTYRRGQSSRKCKDGIITQLYNSSQRTPLACAISSEKNHERKDVLSLIEDASIVGKVVMCDKLNTTADVSSKISKVQAYYLLPLSNTNGNKELHSHLEGIFNREHKKAVIYSETKIEKEALDKSQKGKKPNHGRKDFTDIEVLPAEPYLDERIKIPHEGVTVLVKKTKTTVNILNNEETGKTVKVTYYISSIPFDEDYTIRQVRACFQDYWQIEDNHSVLDDETLFNQDNVQACNKNTIHNTAVLTKISYPILSY